MDRILHLLAALTFFAFMWMGLITVNHLETLHGAFHDTAKIMAALTVTFMLLGGFCLIRVVK